VATVRPEDLKAALGRGECLLGLDVGAKTIGIAISDPSLLIATALATLKRTRFTADARKLADLVAERAVGGLVVGLPVNMDGTEGPRAQSARQFAADLARALDRPVALWDERLSTAAVTRALIEGGMSRARRAEVVDKMAAAYILQGVLDYLAARPR
jgi:putative Holliday junction resolvase